MTSYRVTQKAASVVLTVWDDVPVVQVEGHDTLGFEATLSITDAETLITLLSEKIGEAKHYATSSPGSQHELVEVKFLGRDPYPVASWECSCGKTGTKSTRNVNVDEEKFKRETHYAWRHHKYRMIALHDRGTWRRPKPEAKKGRRG